MKSTNAKWNNIGSVTSRKSFVCHVKVTFVQGVWSWCHPQDDCTHIPPRYINTIRVLLKTCGNTPSENNEVVWRWPGDLTYCTHTVIRYLQSVQWESAQHSNLTDNKNTLNTKDVRYFLTLWFILQSHITRCSCHNQRWNFLTRLLLKVHRPGSLKMFPHHPHGNSRAVGTDLYTLTLFTQVFSLICIIRLPSSHLLPLWWPQVSPTVAPPTFHLSREE